MLTRRKFVAGAASVGVAALIARPSFGAPDPFQTLLNGQYANDIQFLTQEGGLYIADNGLSGVSANNGHTFVLSETPQTWTLQLGRYPGRYNGHPVDLHGYWIFKKGARLCWQAVNYGGGNLQYWNADGRAAGNPERLGAIFVRAS